MLDFVECILATERAESAFEVVDQGAWCVGVRAVGADARAKGDVMADGGFSLVGVGEVGFLV